MGLENEALKEADGFFVWAGLIRIFKNFFHKIENPEFV